MKSINLLIIIFILCAQTVLGQVITYYKVEQYTRKADSLLSRGLADIRRKQPASRRIKPHRIIYVGKET